MTSNDLLPATVLRRKAVVYVYGKTEKRTAIVDGRVRKTYKHGNHPTTRCPVGRRVRWLGEYENGHRCLDQTAP